jgi:hypothetical protein
MGWLFLFLRCQQRLTRKPKAEQTDETFSASPICEMQFDSNQGLVGEKIYFQRRGCKGVTVMKLSALGLVIATGLLSSAPVTIDWSPTKAPSLAVDTADARVGRPLTPMSVAGVNRRVHRRAYVGAAAAGAAGYGYYNYARPCGYYPYPAC